MIVVDIMQSVSMVRTPIYNVGIHGEGEIIAHADTGIDMSVRLFQNFQNNQHQLIIRENVGYYIKTH